MYVSNYWTFLFSKYHICPKNRYFHHSWEAANPQLLRLSKHLVISFIFEQRTSCLYQPFDDFPGVSKTTQCDSINPLRQWKTDLASRLLSLNRAFRMMMDQLLSTFRWAHEIFSA